MWHLLTLYISWIDMVIYVSTGTGIVTPSSRRRTRRELLISTQVLEAGAQGLRARAPRVGDGGARLRDVRPGRGGRSEGVGLRLRFGCGRPGARRREVSSQNARRRHWRIR